MNRLTYVLFSGLVIFGIGGWLCRLAGRTRNKVFRSASGLHRKTPISEAPYIESLAAAGPRYSCAFLEFDERGDYLDFQQHRSCWERIASLSPPEGPPLLVVIYCHGWKNNAQSDDVVRFCAFLGRLAKSEFVHRRGLRVHGIYLAWRGSDFYPYVDKESIEYKETTRDFGEAIVSDRFTRRSPFPLNLVEPFSYWTRKRAAEAHVSGVPIARSVFTFGHCAKGHNSNTQVMLIGHSFGALLLEKSFGQAAVGALLAQWPWSNKPASLDNRLPLDCVLFVNSAAPSIYAKELSDLLWAHDNAMKIAAPSSPCRPVIISITSSADSATGFWHRVGNTLMRLSPSLSRHYNEALVELPKNGAEHPSVPQSYFYLHTPGHNRLLVGHWIVGAEAQASHGPLPKDGKEVMDYNLEASMNSVGSSEFFTSSDDGKVMKWAITEDPSPPDWSTYRGFRPCKRGAYWIIRCDRELIAGHSEVWTQRTMELYAALLQFK